MDIKDLKLGDIVKIGPEIHFPSRFAEGRDFAIISHLSLPDNIHLLTQADFSSSNLSNSSMLPSNESEHITVYTEDEYNLEIEAILSNTAILLENYKKALREIYPNSSVFTISEGKMTAYVLFENIVLETDYNLTVNIKNLVFRISFKDDGTIYEIRSSRYKATKREIITCYGHPHSDRNCLFKFTKEVCFGNTSINNNYNGLKLDISLEDFELFLIQLKDYVVYESSKGGPHIRSSELFSIGNVSRENYIEKYWIDKLTILGFEPETSLESSGSDIAFIIDNKSISDFMLKDTIIRNELEDQNLIGLMIEGNFSMLGAINYDDHSSELERFTNSQSLSVSDDINSINLTREIDTEEISEENLKQYEHVFKRLISKIANSYSKSIKELLLKEQLYA